MALFNSLTAIAEQLRWCGYECEAGKLEDNVAFRQLEKMATYSHRNGETEPPTVLGTYWFAGEVKTHFGGFVTEGKGEAVLFDENTLVWFQGDQGGYTPSTCVGQWWGPIVPPWDEQSTEQEK